MSKRMYIIPETEAIEIKTLGVLMASGDDPSDQEHGSSSSTDFDQNNIRRRVF